jgi:hypothetical protein
VHGGCWPCKATVTPPQNPGSLAFPVPPGSLSFQVHDCAAGPPTGFELPGEQFDRRPLPGRAGPFQRDGEGVLDRVYRVGQRVGQGWASLLGGVTRGVEICGILALYVRRRIEVPF